MKGIDSVEKKRKKMRKRLCKRGFLGAIPQGSQRD